MRSSEFCIGHDPAKADERRRRASKGGKRGGRGRPQAELAGLKTRLSDLADDVLAGNVNRASAAVVGQLLNTIIRAVSVELKAREQLELEARLEELESALEYQKGDHRGYG
jgi:LPS O-antigen subunit length determinant protein (WzzB/FepE family)